MDWNKLSKDFHLLLGVKPMSDWAIYRLATKTLRHLAEGSGLRAR